MITSLYLLDGIYARLYIRDNETWQSVTEMFVVCDKCDIDFRITEI